MGSLLFLGSLAWKSIFAEYNGIEMRNMLIILHIIGWVFQFIGHGVFESKTLNITSERRPALFDNISQIFSAPLFVVIELFDLLGFRTSEIKEW